MKETVSPHLVLVGTAHVSKDSVAEVEQTIRDERPDVVAVELDSGRLETLENRRQWEQTPIHELLKSQKLWLFLTQSLLASYQRRIGDELGVEPGQEMLAAVVAARAQNAEVLLADREIRITMRRATALMRFREKLRLAWELMKSMLPRDEPTEEEDIRELLKEDVLSQMMQELGRMAPSVKTVVLDERDEYLAARIRTPVETGKKVVAVVGAGHVAGIKQHLSQPRRDTSALDTIPQKRVPVGKIVGWALPLAVLVLFVYLGWDGYQKGNFQKVLDAALYWTLVTGGLAALGTLLARGHVLSIITAFFAAPITTLHPLLAAGWFAGLTEAWVRTPVVADFQGLSRLKTMKDFFDNRVMRVLLVAALANVGAMIGFIVGGTEIIRRVLEP